MYVWPAPPPGSGRRRPSIVAAGIALALVVAIAGGTYLTGSGQTGSGQTGPGRSSGPSGSSTGSVTIFGGEPSSLDPAVQSDMDSAQVVAQLFESLTAIDTAGNVQPALADSWQSSNGGERLVFHLRSGLVFSDGSPLVAADVISSWMRVLDPAQPSQLASLLDDVVGAQAYREGSGAKSAVGLSAIGDDQIEVDFTSPSPEFPAIAASPTLAVVPPTIDSNPNALTPNGFVGSGAYILSGLTDTEVTLTANRHYWAGTPSIATVHQLFSIGGDSPVSDFESGTLDYTPISYDDASWIAYDKTLGPLLHVDQSPSVEFYGFDTSRPPFSDVHVRRAFQMGIDWRGIIALQADPLMQPATGMVPPDVPGHSATDFGPVFNLTQARAELAAAGYPNGVGFPKITLVTAGAPLDEAIVRQLHDNLGIDIGYETRDFASYNEELLTNPPAFWEMDWVADYPGANDFLGLLLGTGKTNNFGRWSSSDFDNDIDQALAAGDQASMQQALDGAQAVVLDQAPVIPVDYDGGYSLAKSNLLGAVTNGQGLMRYASLAWGSGS
jgi:oligopeptide transport system substrate-binding protein